MFGYFHYETQSLLRLILLLSGNPHPPVKNIEKENERAITQYNLVFLRLN